MRHVRTLEQAQPDRPTLVTIGMFDGVHRGHQLVIRQMLKAAAALDVSSAVLTFYPHPEIVLRGPRPRFYLTTPDERARLLHALGVELVITHPFDDDVRHIRAAAFVDRLLQHLKMRELWVGADFAMGYQREGDVTFLMAQAAEKDFTLRVIDLMDAGGEKVSSSRVRAALAEGDIADATHSLGRPFRLTGTVVEGAKRGRTIGIPTANVLPEEELAVPAHGVYAAWASVSGKLLPAVVNIGVRPTFDDSAQTVVEAHLLDYEADLYGQDIALDFVARLRAEQRFDGVEALVAQIKRDVETARHLLANQSSGG